MAAALIADPWARVKTPPPIPAPVRAGALEQLDDLAFARLIQSHQVPRDQDPDGRRNWDLLWRVLREDDELADRTYTVLEQFLETTEDALDAGGLDEAAAKRASKFAQQCDMSWKRLDRGRDRDGALGWAGEAAEAHPARSRRVIASLIGAIARHRSEVLRATHGRPSAADAALWDVMAALRLDPRDYGDQED